MEKRIIIGRIIGAYGVHGWVKIRSFTVPIDNIFKYSPWELGFPNGKTSDQVMVIDGQIHGNICLAKTASCVDRDAALRLAGADIVIARNRLPYVDEEEYYWEDLLGCRVITRENIDIGHVSRMIETGANDVLVVKGERERLIPYVIGKVILAVELENRIIRVDWDTEF
uniref:Ribosome maturation factor RimM n=1 Tax=Candidatus Kentrum sp. MB TaxID=2138164 RepID=A0A451BCI0_9GAMM|nr:MAG: 16S rRNA processing protein RimM [Candidatus Kentron sp. MB]VFK32611.1 MAG: 16S rRNA processing protein RimM [Candidatus Kentron sp. MB]VFK75997.1 MAG: 16S rRNA processing protein RimM [Candidatus Kentron sp. MB]